MSTPSAASSPEQADVLTVTLNPALDLASEVDEVLPGPKLRCTMPAVDPGGGGINVARAIARLDGHARAFVPLGGGIGMRLGRLLADEGIETVSFEAPGETRQNLAVTERATGRQFRFVLPGPDWERARIDAAVAAVAGAARPGGIVVLSGSQPPGAGPDLPGDIARALGQVGEVRLVIDTSGAPLRVLARGHGRHPRPEVLRMDDAEGEEIAGHPLPERADTAAFARDLVARGAARIVIVARGADGSVMAAEGQAWHCTAAPVEVRSAIGAGDSFTGAFVLALARGEGPPEALRRGAAAASAAVTTEATRLFEKEAFRALLPECRLSPM